LDLFFFVKKTAYRDWLDRWRGAFGVHRRRQNADGAAAPAVSALNNDLMELSPNYSYFVFILLFLFLLSILFIFLLFRNCGAAVSADGAGMPAPSAPEAPTALSALPALTAFNWNILSPPPPPPSAFQWYFLYFLFDDIFIVCFLRFSSVGTAVGADSQRRRRWQR